MTRSNRVVDLRKKRSEARADEQRELPFSHTSGRRKRQPLRARRRRARVFLGLGALLALLALAASVSYVSYLPQFNVERILVSGTTDTPAQAIESVANSVIHESSRAFLSPSNIFLYHPQAVAQAVETSFPRIKSAQVSRPSLFSTTVTIAVEERQPFALWCSSTASSSPQTEDMSNASSSSSCYILDETGVLFSQNDTSTTLATSYIFTGGIGSTTGTTSQIGSTFAAGHLEGLLSFLQFLTLDGFIPQGASVENDQDFTVLLGAGFYVKASFGENAEDLAKNLQLVLSSDALSDKEDQLEYVDLRFGDRVYYKMKGAAETVSGN